MLCFLLYINFVNQEEKKRKIEIINQQIKGIGFEKTSLKYNESLLKDNQGDLGWVNNKNQGTESEVML